MAADWGKWAVEWLAVPGNAQRPGETSAASGDRMVNAFYAQINTVQERMQVGMSAFPEYNAGVYFDERNDPSDQPDWIDGRGQTGVPIPAW